MVVLLAAAFCTDPSALAAPANPASPAGAQETESPLPVFELHSGFWVNLHHFLYLQARLMRGNPSSMDSARGEAPPNEPPASLLDFPAEEIRAWQDAVAFYAKDLAGRDLLLNGDMENINNQLSAMEACADLEGKSSALCKSGLRRDLIEALERAAPVYRGIGGPNTIVQTAHGLRKLRRWSGKWEWDFPDSLRTFTRDPGRRGSCGWT